MTAIITALGIVAALGLRLYVGYNYSNWFNELPAEQRSRIIEAKLRCTY